MVDKPKLDQMLANMRSYLQILQSLARVPSDVFLANPDKIGNAKYHLVIAIECCIDIAHHIIASQNYRFPKNNADSFAILVEQGVVPGSLRDSLRAMASFRNRLVHLYWDVDSARVHEYLRSSLADLEQFGSEIARHTW